MKMTTDEAIAFADEWADGMTFHEGSQGWRVVCKLLARMGCLMTEESGGKVSYTRKERLPGGEGNVRCYRITHKLMEGGSDE